MSFRAAVTSVELAEARARIAELEAELALEKESGDIANKQWSEWMTRARQLNALIATKEHEADTCIVDLEKRVYKGEAEMAKLKARGAELATMADPGAPSTDGCSECGVLEDHAVLKAELVALKVENKRLKCCGNCKHSEYDGSYFDCKWQPRGEDEWDDLAYPSLTLCCYAPSRWEARP